MKYCLPFGLLLTSLQYFSFPFTSTGLTTNASFTTYDQTYNVSKTSNNAFISTALTTDATTTVVVDSYRSLSTESIFPASKTEVTRDELTTTDDPVLYELCSFEIINPDVREHVQNFLSNEKELIFLHLRFQDNYQTSPVERTGNIYNPLEWVRTAGRHGDRLLLMQPQFEALSLGLLKFGVEHINIELKKHPSKCLQNKSLKQLKKEILEFLTKELRLLQHENVNDQERLCNMEIENVKDVAKFYYNCCHLNDTKQFSCGKIPENKLMEILFVAMNVAYVLVFAFCPLLIPKWWYKNPEAKYLFVFVNPLTLKVEQVQTEKVNVASQECVMRMNQLLSGGNQSGIFKVKTAVVSIKEPNVVTARFVPVGIFQYFYKQFISCKIKNQKDLKNCCNSRVIVIPCKTKDSNDGTSLKWSSCFQPVMKFAFVIYLLIPWFLRIVFFYVFEHPNRIARIKISRIFHLAYPSIPESSLIYTFTPVHPFFIVFYIQIGLFPFVQRCIKSLLASSNIDDLSRTMNFALGKIIRTLVCPCERHGIFGCMIIPFYWIIMIPYVFVIYVLPAVPLLRLIFTLIRFVFQEVRSFRCEYSCIDIFKNMFKPFSAFLLFITVTSCMIICMEVLIFFFQIFVYSFIGLILNASLVLTYVTFAGMLLFYAYDTIRNIELKYKVFSRAVLEYFVRALENPESKIKRDSIYPIISPRLSNYDEGKCTNNRDECINNIQVIDRKIVLSTKQPYLLFDENGEPCMKEDGFFKMCELKTVAAPGSLWKCYKSAFINFLAIVLFLFFVAFVVITFGQSQGVPGTYQALASLGGGLVPLIIRRYFFKDHNIMELKSDQPLVDEEVIEMFKDTETDIMDILDIKAFNTDVSPNVQVDCNISVQAIDTNESKA